MLGIERVRAHAFTDGADLPIVLHDLAGMTVLAIEAADRVRRRHGRGPHRGRRPLRDGLPLKRRLALRGEIAVHLRDHAFDTPGIHVTAEFGMNPAGMHRGGANTAVAMPPVEPDREKD